MKLNVEVYLGYFLNLKWFLLGNGQLAMGNGHFLNNEVFLVPLKCPLLNVVVFLWNIQKKFLVFS